MLAASTHRDVLRRLRYDKRKAGAHGRCLSEDLPSLGLLVGDRLEPCDFLRDVGTFESLTRFPCPVLFWRTSKETLTRHRCPLLDLELHTSPKMVMTVDVMHTLYLGVMLAFAEKVVWHMLLAGAWAMSTSADEQVAMSAQMSRSDFRNWMRQYHAAIRTKS